MPTPIQNPAPFVPSRAMSFAALDGSSQLVSVEWPLPVTTLPPAPGVLAGMVSASAQVGPYQPAPGRPVVLTLSGEWVGTARLLRSSDGGITRSPLTVGGQAWGEFTQNCCEAVWEEFEEAATLYLDLAMVSGTLHYRFAQ